VRVFWAFDVISPFSYLSLKQLARLPQDTTLEFVPVLFAGLLNHFGQMGNAEIGPKRRFTYRFALWRARKMGIEMRLPPAHPFNPIQAQRLIIAAGSDRHAVDTVFNAVFLHGLDVTDPAVIGELARQLGIADPTAALEDPTVKKRLRDNTDWAIAQGVFGVPSFVIGTETFWGHDSFEMVLDYLRDPDEFQDAEMQKVERLPIGVVRPRKKQ
jgi:2-hydroxychromene-2-carboxylate isomerase